MVVVMAHLEVVVMNHFCSFFNWRTRWYLAHLNEDDVIPSDELERYANALDEYIEQDLSELPDDEKIGVAKVL